MSDPTTSVRPLERRDLPAALAIQSATYPAFLLEDEPAFANRLDVASAIPCFFSRSIAIPLA